MLAHCIDQDCRVFLVIFSKDGGEGMRTAMLDEAAALCGSCCDSEGAVDGRAGESGGECEEGGAEEEEELDHDGGHGDWFGLCCYCDGGFDGDRFGLL